MLGGGLSHRFCRWLGSEGLPHSESSWAKTFEPPTSRGRELWERYGLGRFSPSLPPRTARESLGLLDLLDRIAPVPETRDGALRVLDVGADSWRYLPALACWLDRGTVGAAQVDGVELDAHRLRLNLRSPASSGRFHAELMNQAGRQGAFRGRPRFGYHAADIRSWSGEADLVTWLFPFVLEGPHRSWGLPAGLFSPRECFEAVVGKMLRPGGRLLMANQGEWEWQEAERLCAGLPLRPSFHETVEGSLHASAYPIFLTLWTRAE